MAHFAELSADNIVTQVIVVANAELMDGGTESEAKGVDFLESLYGHDRNWKQTSTTATSATTTLESGLRMTLAAMRLSRRSRLPHGRWTRRPAAGCRRCHIRPMAVCTAGTKTLERG
jgi:hypothetical protein